MAEVQLEASSGEPRMLLKLQSMSNRGFALLFVLFFSALAACLLAGVLGPPIPTAPHGLPIVLGGACDENPAAVEFLK